MQNHEVFFWAVCCRIETWESLYRRESLRAFNSWEYGKILRGRKHKALTWFHLVCSIMPKQFSVFLLVGGHTAPLNWTVNIMENFTARKIDYWIVTPILIQALIIIVFNLPASFLVRLTISNSIICHQHFPGTHFVLSVPFTKPCQYGQST